MTKFVMNWCKMMFTQNGRAIQVRTGLCQEGVLRAKGTGKEMTEIISGASLFGPNQLVELEENIVYLNRREVSFVNKEVNRLLKARVEETKRKKKAGIPPPPTPGKIAYAVYQ